MKESRAFVLKNNNNTIKTPAWLHSGFFCTGLLSEHHRIVWVEGTFQGPLIQPPCNEQLQLDH